MAASTIENVVAGLKDIIDKNGPSYLTEESYEVFRELMDSGTTDRKTAAGILHPPASGIMSSIDFPYDPEEISGSIRRECSINKRMADRIALILTSLYSGENRKAWKGKDREGLRQFLKEEFTCLWKGFAVRDAGNGTVDCHYEAEIILIPTERISEDKALAQQLQKNPFMTKEAIHDLFTKRLHEYLDHEFEYYCTCEDYYQPVVEDFGSNLEYDLPKWCKENGFEYVSFEGDGEDDGYEPKFRNNWY